MSSDPYETPELREILLYQENDEPLYRMEQAIRQNLARKMVRGKYDASKAVTGWKYLADATSKRYAKEFGSGFSVETRKQAAVFWARNFEKEMHSGGLADLYKIANLRPSTRKTSAMRLNPFKRRGTRRVYETKEHRTVRHADAAKSAASSLLLARKKAKKQHKRMPNRQGRLAVASATIALRLGGQRTRQKARAKKAHAKKMRPVTVKVRAVKPTAKLIPPTKTLARRVQDTWSYMLETWG